MGICRARLTNCPGALTEFFDTADWVPADIWSVEISAEQLKKILLETYREPSDPADCIHELGTAQWFSYSSLLFWYMWYLHSASQYVRPDSSCIS